MAGSSDDAAVREANRAFYAAFEALDLEAMRGVWSAVDPISCVHPGWEPIFGCAAVMESWAGIFRGTEAIEFALRDIRVSIFEGTAWVVLVEQINARHRDRTLVASALTTNVFVRGSKGWSLIHHHAGPVLNGNESGPEGSERSSSGSGKNDRTLH
jgi:ketosteroid isomerase-like protein